MKPRGDGLHTWVLQRISAVYIGLFVIYMIIHFGYSAPLGYEEWHGWVSSPVVKTAISLFLFSILIHMWVGLRDVIMDYIHPPTVRFLLLIIVISALLTMAVWMLQILQGVIAQ